jgi:hypothetical protein
MDVISFQASHQSNARIIGCGKFLENSFPSESVITNSHVYSVFRCLAIGMLDNFQFAGSQRFKAILRLDITRASYS